MWCGEIVSRWFCTWFVILGSGGFRFFQLLADLLQCRRQCRLGHRESEAEKGTEVHTGQTWRIVRFEVPNGFYSAERLQTWICFENTSGYFKVADEHIVIAWNGGIPPERFAEVLHKCGRGGKGPA